MALSTPSYQAYLAGTLFVPMELGAGKRPGEEDAETVASPRTRARAEAEERLPWWQRQPASFQTEQEQQQQQQHSSSTERLHHRPQQQNVPPHTWASEPEDEVTVAPVPDEVNAGTSNVKGGMMSPAPPLSSSPAVEVRMTGMSSPPVVEVRIDSPAAHPSLPNSWRCAASGAAAPARGGTAALMGVGGDSPPDQGIEMAPILSSGAAVWDSAANVFKTRVMLPQPSMMGSDPGSAAASRSAGAVEGRGPAGGPRIVTVRIKGQGGAPDTEVTIEIP